MKGVSLLLIVSSVLSSFLSSIALANSLVRVTPRSDYASDATALSRIKDRWSQKGALIQGQMMGGNYDVVLEKDSATSEITVNRCPTAKACFETTPDAEESCFAEQQHWNCETVYKDTSANFCRFYAIGNRARAIVNFIGDQAVAGAITSPFAFFQKGIGLASTRISTGFSAFDALKAVVVTECSASLPAATGVAGQIQAQVSSVKVFSEIEKGEVRNFLELFTPNSPGTSSGDIEVYQQSTYPKARQFQLR